MPGVTGATEVACRRPVAHARVLASVPGRLTTHDVNVRDVNFARYREECLREGIDPHTVVEVEALRTGLLRQRLDETIEGLVDDGRGTSRPAPKRPSGNFCALCKDRCRRSSSTPQTSCLPPTTTSRTRAPHVLHPLQCSQSLLSCGNPIRTLAGPRRNVGDVQPNGGDVGAAHALPRGESTLDVVPQSLPAGRSSRRRQR